MHISMIAAMAHNRVIGKDNKMPWHLPEDLRHFKKMTVGKPVIMGRKTFVSIGRPLPNRQNIVITRQADYQAAGVTTVTSFADAVQAAGNVDEVVIIGGGQLYAQLLPQATRLYLTFIDLDVAGDTHFPQWDEASWQQTAIETGTGANGLEFSFVTLDRR